MLKPDVIAYIIEVGHRQERLVLENRSEVSAFEIDLKLHLKPRQLDPFPQGIREETFPIKELYGKDKRQILFSLDKDTGIEFEAEWEWKNENGEVFKRQNKISLRK